MRPILALLAIATPLILCTPASTHTHVDPDGDTVAWYPKECCHDRDCRPVANIWPGNQGLWMTTVDGRTVLVGADEQRRPSRDMRWHVCLGDDIHHNTVVQCVCEPSSAARHQKPKGTDGRRLSAASQFQRDAEVSLTPGMD
jgi:hypothetical protein